MANVFGHTWWKITAKGLAKARHWKTSWRELWSAEAAILLVMKEYPNKSWKDSEIRRGTYGGTLDREDVINKALRSLARKGYIKQMKDR